MSSDKETSNGIERRPTSVLLENVLSPIHQKLPKTVPPWSNVSLLFYGNMASTDLHDRNDSDLYGAALSLWNALNHRTGIEPHIRVYNPELTRHGWQSPIPSSRSSCRFPFLVDSIRMALKRLNITAHMMPPAAAPDPQRRRQDWRHPGTGQHRRADLGGNRLPHRNRSPDR